MQKLDSKKAGRQDLLYMKSSPKINSQFTCTICGDGYNQKSRLDRHMATSHPPSAPSAAEVEKEGITVGDMQKKMVEKIEELTLYIIDLQKQIDALKAK